MKELRQRIEYNHVNDCITVDEFQSLLRYCRRGSVYYTYWLLKASAGPRGGEIVDWRLGNINPDFSVIDWETEKARKKNESGRIVEITKHRSAELDSFVKNELVQYLLDFFGMEEVNGKTRILSPYGHGHLFPWMRGSFKIPDPDPKRRRNKAVNVTEDYFCKWRVKMSLKNPSYNRLAFKSTGGGQKDSLFYVLRPHILRHFAATIFFYKNGQDMRLTQQFMRHSKMSVTEGYVHSAKALGRTPEQIKNMSWAEIAGYPEQAQEVLQVEIQRTVTAY